jgi:hypothetical protein
VTEKRGETFVMRDPDDGRSIDLTAFLLGLASTAFIQLGLREHPETHERSPADLPAARETLEILAMLREKTRGNLTPDEERFFETLLADLRLRYVEASRK